MRLTVPLCGYFIPRGPHPGRGRKNKWKKGAHLVVPKKVSFADPRLQTAVEQSGKPVENVFWNPPWEKKEVNLRIYLRIRLSSLSFMIQSKLAVTDPPLMDPRRNCSRIESSASVCMDCSLVLGLHLGYYQTSTKRQRRHEQNF